MEAAREEVAKLESSNRNFRLINPGGIVPKQIAPRDIALLSLLRTTTGEQSPLKLINPRGIVPMLAASTGSKLIGMLIKSFKIQHAWYPMLLGRIGERLKAEEPARAKL